MPSLPETSPTEGATHVRQFGGTVHVQIRHGSTFCIDFDEQTRCTVRYSAGVGRGSA
jgi:hypothetical protein